MSEEAKEYLDEKLGSGHVIYNMSNPQSPKVDLEKLLQSYATHHLQKTLSKFTEEKVKELCAINYNPGIDQNTKYKLDAKVLAKIEGANIVLYELKNNM